MEMNEKMPMQYCIYLRKSRADAEAEARGEGETLIRHEKTLLELSLRLNLPVTKIYREIVSGETIAARPVMQQLLTEVENGIWNGVLVMEVERLARGDTVDQGIIAQTFKFSGAKIITPMKTYDPTDEFDEEYFEFGLFMSRREFKTINRRLQQGRRASIKEGKYAANRAPYGYRRQKLPQEKGYTLIPDEEEAKILRLIFHLYTVGDLESDGTYRRLGASLIAQKLDRMGIPPPQRGSHWSPASIYDMLSNPVYTGKLRWNWRSSQKQMRQGKIKITRPRSKEYLLIAGRHEAIIQNELFIEAQKIRSAHSLGPVNREHTTKNPLAGLVICRNCGYKMVRKPHKSNNTLTCPEPRCQTVSANLELVEQRVLEGLAAWLGEYQAIFEQPPFQNNTAALQTMLSAIESLQVETKMLEQQRDRLYDFLEQGVYDPDIFQERQKDLCGRIKAKQECLKSLQDEREGEKATAAKRGNAIPKEKGLISVYPNLQQAKAKNDLLKEIIKEIVYTKASGGRWSGQEDSFTLTIRPKLPKSISP